MKVDRNELRRLLLFAVAVLVLCFIALAYRPALHGAFIWDDHAMVESDAAYKHASFAELFTRPFWADSPFSDTTAPYFRPLVLASFRFDLLLGGTPVEFHFTNIALHLTACALLAIVAVRAGASYPSAFLAMLLWGVFPRSTEAVAWVVGRTDVLAAVFGLAALAVWPEISARSPRATWPRSVLGGVFLFGSFASKEVGLAFGGVVFAAVIFRGGSRSTLARLGVCLGLPLIAYFALRSAAFAGIEPSASRALGFATRLETILEACGRYVAMVFDPFHSRTSIGLIGKPALGYVLGGAVVLVFAGGAAVRYGRSSAVGLRLGVFLALLGIAPVIQIVPLALTSAVVADRFLYVPLAGVAVAGAVALSHRGRRAGVAALALAFVLAVATNLRAEDYFEETAFWTIAAENAHPLNAAPRMALARWLISSGEPAPGCALYEHSLGMLRAAGLADRPPYRRARESLAGCWARIGRYDESLALSRDLATEFPDRARIRLGLGFAELHVRDFDRAAEEFALAATLEDGALASFVVPRALIATLRANDARVDELSPRKRAEHFAGLGRGPEAAAEWRAVALNPRASAGSRMDALFYLLREGTFEQANEAYDAVPRPKDGWDTNRMADFRRRRRAHDAYTVLQSRIAALAR